MSTFPGSPRLTKGGIVLLDPITAAVVRLIVLQYNPDTVTRTLQVQGASEQADHSEALRLKGPPVETIKLDAELDLTDQLEAGAGQNGLHAQLAALETMVYPTSAQLSANNALAQAGTLEIMPMEAPLPVFVWSKHRVVPVRFTDFSITEEAFDPELNPIRAKVSLGMRVLNVHDLGFQHKGGSLFMTYLQTKERLASLVPSGTFRALGIGGIT
ncbi:hypothetical protein [Sorangium sp. So ce131]|uniref:hypothetical protein n=1 Tax=Sorangium sp. So ce131 TaxID=3133282 RepID=UPI003F5EF71A